MSLKVRKRPRTSIPPLDDGSYVAICVGIVDLGEQHSKRYNKDQDKIWVAWEIKDEFVNIEGEEKPRWVSAKYTKSLHENSNLRKALKAWRKRDFTDDELMDDFDMMTMLGTECMLQVSIYEGDNGPQNDVDGISSLPKGVKVGKPISELFYFDMDDPDTYGALEKMPKHIAKQVKGSHTWQAMHANSEEMGMDEDEEYDESDVDKETGEINRSASF